MSSTSDSRRPAARIASLAWPILVGQLAVIANGVIDTAMTSRYSATDLAALSIGVAIYLSVFVGANGVLQALMPIIGQLFGAKRFDEVGAEVRQGIWLGIFLTFIGGLILLFPEPLLSLAHASPQLHAKAAAYLHALSFALPATLGFRIYGALNTAVARPKALMAIQVGALFLKVPLNALFIFGGLGLPAFGGPGCAMATATVSWISLAIGFTIVRVSPFYRPFHIFGHGFGRPRWRAQLALLKLGIPMGLSYLIEVSAFAFMALFIARMGDTVVAGHQIVANFTTVLYMMPLSIASANGTLVAHAIGARDFTAARRIAFVGIGMALGLATLSGVLVWLLRSVIVHAYTPDPSIVAVALPLITFISVYHFFDAMQVSAAFVLRAYKIAVIPTVIYAVMLWGVGLGGGYLLGFRVFDWIPVRFTGAAGYWLGNTASVALAGISLLWYLHAVQHKQKS